MLLPLYYAQKYAFILIDRLEHNMLKNLPIIPSQTSTHYSYFIPMVPPIYPFLFYCVSNNITMKE